MPCSASSSMTLAEAICKRRAVRDYKPEPVSKETISELLDAAVLAPTAMHLEPWAFVVIQDKELLDRLSEMAKDIVRAEAEKSASPVAQRKAGFVNEPNFNVFYNAPALIVVCSRNQEPIGMADCWLAAENLMLTARAKGLGTCVIGLSIGLFNAPETKALLGIPPETMAVAPILLGVPTTEPPVVSRNPPKVIAWK